MRIVLEGSYLIYLDFDCLKVVSKGVLLVSDFHQSLAVPASILAVAVGVRTASGVSIRAVD
jgi:hypothetical protein